MNTKSNSSKRRFRAVSSSRLLAEKAKPGDHFWALSLGKLVVVMKDDWDAYHVCGPWECGVLDSEVELLETIDRPVGHEKTQLYYS